MRRFVLMFGLLVGWGNSLWSEDVSGTSEDVWDQVRHHYAMNGDVRIHYVSLGEGPLVVMIHGFPDFWYTWRDQMKVLSKDYRCVALDLRGYHLSDHPKGQAAYDLANVVEDIGAVIQDVGVEKAIVVGHDWGGMVAWRFAMAHGDKVDRLAILNLPHPRGLMRELELNPDQQKASQYARDFQKEGAHLGIQPEHLVFWVKDEAVRRRYVEAFQKSDIEAMLHYYKQNYPREPYSQEGVMNLPKVMMPVLMIHGLKDTALLSPALNGTWDWVGKDLTLVTIPDAGHFVQQDASELVSRSLRMWLGRDGG